MDKKIEKTEVLTFLQQSLDTSLESDVKRWGLNYFSNKEVVFIANDETDKLHDYYQLISNLGGIPGNLPFSNSNMFIVLSDSFPKSTGEFTKEWTQLFTLAEKCTKKRTSIMIISFEMVYEYVENRSNSIGDNATLAILKRISNERIK
jgi:hypothetical protein